MGLSHDPHIKPTATPAWQALTVPTTIRSRRCICGRCSRRTPAVANGLWRKGLAFISTTQRTASPRRRCGCCCGLRKSAASRCGATRCFAGKRSNITEGRAAFHMALRAPKGSVMRIDGHDVVPDVHAVLDHMGEFARRLRDGTWRGHTGKPIRNVVNVGIGVGSRTGDGRSALR